jgi:hypothetical protein
MDELAVALDIDPLQLRLINDTDIDPELGVPLNGRRLGDCLREGAKRFGWDQRPPKPASRREGRKSLRTTTLRSGEVASDRFGTKRTSERAAYWDVPRFTAPDTHANCHVSSPCALTSASRLSVAMIGVQRAPRKSNLPRKSMRKPQTNYGRTSSKAGRTGFEKMQMSHQRTRKEIERIRLERTKRTETGKPRHIEGSHRR